MINIICYAYYGPNFSCTESTSYPEKKKRLELNLWISVKNIWGFFGEWGHPVLLLAKRFQ